MQKNGAIIRVVIGIALIAVLAVPLARIVAPPPPDPVSYSWLMQAIRAHKVQEAVFNASGNEITVLTADRQVYVASVGPQAPRIQSILDQEGIPVAYRTERQELGIFGILQALISLLFPLFLLLAIIGLFRASRGGSGGGSSPFTFGKSTAKVVPEASTGVTFADVAGVDEAKEELQEVVTFLKQPERFTAVGAKIPRGALLVGSPGTGKTLLARAVAGEAGVPFFSVSGSEFVEMFVGVGASRVRDLFTKAKEKAPCIVFIDEIDAVGRQRGVGLGNGNDEREQTLNQLLTELDGFQGNSGVIVIGATNRPDVLDSALLRPGRFDRRVIVEPPDFQGRLAILGVHSRGKAFSNNVDMTLVARRTPGFSGADLANLLNEAAIFAARKGLTEISNAEIMDAIDRIVAGAEKRGKVLNSVTKRIVAYHEAGHAIMGLVSKGFDPVQKVTIVPRGMAGGLTWFTPSEEEVDSGLKSKRYFEMELRVSLGGRAAEELLLGPDDFTNGASNDLQRVAERVYQMITRFGMSDLLGPLALRYSNSGMFLGRSGGVDEMSCSPELASKIDSEAKRMVDEAYRETKEILEQYRPALDELAATLMSKEVVERDELLALASRHNFAFQLGLS